MLVRGFIRGFLRGLKRGLGTTFGGGISVRLVTEGSSSVDGGPYATASITADVGRLYLLAVSTSLAGATSPNSVTGAGLTWALAGAGSNGSGNRRTSWWWADGVAGSGALSIGFADVPTGIAWSVIEATGAKAGAPRQATAASANSTTITGTLAALASSRSAHIYCCGRAVQEVTALPVAPGWTELSDHPNTSWLTPAGMHQVAYAIGLTGAAPAWATSGVVQIVDLEIESA